MNTKKANVLHYGISYFPYKGGSSARLHKLITKQPNTNFHIVTTTKAENNDLYDTKAIHRVRSYYSLSTVRLLLNTVIDSKIDAVVLHNNRVALVWLALIDPVLRRRMIIEIHNFRDNTPAKRLLSRILYSQVHNIVVMSKRAMSYVNETYKVPHRRIKPIRNGIPAKTDPPPLIEQNLKYTFSYIGSFYDWQGVSIIAEAILLLPQTLFDSIKFVFAGGGPLYDYVKERLSSIDKRLEIEYLDWITPDQASQKTQQSDVILMPRLSTTGTEYIVPLKAIEAITLNKHVIASHVGGLIEGLEGYPNLTFVEPGDSRALAITIEQCSINRPKAKRTSQISYTDTWEQCGKQYEDIYQKEKVAII